MTMPPPPESSPPQRPTRRSGGIVVGWVVASLLAGMVALSAVFAAFDLASGPDTGPQATSAVATDAGLQVGPNGAPREVVIYEDFSCVHCASFETTGGERLTALAEAGKIRLEHRPIAILGPQSARAANAFRVVLVEAGPEVATTYHHLLYVHHDDIAAADDDWLVDLAVEAGAVESAVRGGIESADQLDWVRTATQQAQDAAVSGTPTVILDGEIFTEGASAAELAEALVAELQ